jgi:hypothetical protein
MVLPYDDAINARLADMKPEQRDGFIGRARSIGLVLEGFKTKVSSLKNSGRYLPQGVKEETAAAAVAARLALAERRKAYVDPVEGEIVQERARLRALASADAAKADPVLAFLKQQEIRSRLTGLEDFKISALLAQAVERGDADFIEALRGAPRAFPVVDFAELRKIDDQRIAAAHPELAERETFVANLNHALNVADSHISEVLQAEGLPPHDDSIRVL